METPAPHSVSARPGTRSFFGERVDSVTRHFDVAVSIAMPQFLILNGKKAGDPVLREAVGRLRDEGAELAVRVTWESGDLDRYLAEAISAGCGRVVIGGGDGSLNEALVSLMKGPAARPALGILPLGTANDFATSAGIPTEPEAALRLALQGTPRPIDVIAVNDTWCLNVTSMGFGAEVTANTPTELKHFLGGGAYTLSGLVQALNFKPCPSRAVLPDRTVEQAIVVAAICNGRTAGGGQPLAPAALLDDGLMDVIAITEFSLGDAAAVVRELVNEEGGDNRFVHRFRLPWLEGSSDHPIPINLDGEPYAASRIRLEVLPRVLEVVLPENCPCLAGNVVAESG